MLEASNDQRDTSSQQCDHKCYFEFKVVSNKSNGDQNNLMPHLGIKYFKSI